MNNRAAWSSPTTSRMIAPDTGIALGLGLTNECNLSCAFCYHRRRGARVSVKHPPPQLRHEKVAGTIPANS